MGAWRTSKRRPWIHKCIIGGFPNEKTALQFGEYFNYNYIYRIITVGYVSIYFNEQLKMFHKIISLCIPLTTVMSPDSNNLYYDNIEWQWQHPQHSRLRNHFNKENIDQQQQKRNYGRVNRHLENLLNLFQLTLWKQLNLTVYCLDSKDYNFIMKMLDRSQCCTDSPSHLINDVNPSHSFEMKLINVEEVEFLHFSAAIELDEIIRQVQPNYGRDDDISHQLKSTCGHCQQEISQTTTSGKDY
jgi:hypothetical protein